MSGAAIAAIIGLIGSAASMAAKASRAKKQRAAEAAQIKAMEEEASKAQAARGPDAGIRLANLGGLNDLMARYYGEGRRRDLSPEAVFGANRFAPTAAPAAAPAAPAPVRPGISPVREGWK